MDNFTFIDLFSGIGGFRIALQRLGGECLFSSEIDKYCRETYKVNFNETPFGDIRSINENELPEHDILTAGFPCQPFSISGHKQGFKDIRGTLFNEIMRIVKAKKPKIVLLENVKYMIYHDRKKTLKTILKSLHDENYYVSWDVLNAKDFGLAQNRERLFIVASKDEKFDFNQIKIPKHNVIIKDILDTDNSNFEYLDESEYTILDRNLWKKQKSGLIFCGFRNKEIRKKGVLENTKHLSRVHKQPNRIYHINGTHPTLPSQETSGRYWIYDGQKVRKLTINECFKLMGFPTDFIKTSPKGELYKQIGNSVPINTVYEIGKAIKNQFLIGDESSHKQELFDNLYL